MPINVEIADRLYDYTDEEKAAEAVAEFQDRFRLSEDQIIEIWTNATDTRRGELERVIVAAIDANGSVKRAQDHIPTALELSIA